MRCPSCGTDNEVGSKFCMTCGSPIASNPTEATDVPVPSGEPEITASPAPVEDSAVAPAGPAVEGAATVDEGIAVDPSGTSVDVSPQPSPVAPPPVMPPPTDPSEWDAAGPPERPPVVAEEPEAVQPPPPPGPPPSMPGPIAVSPSWASSAGVDPLETDSTAAGSGDVSAPNPPAWSPAPAAAPPPPPAGSAPPPPASAPAGWAASAPPPPVGAPPPPAGPATWAPQAPASPPATDGGWNAPPPPPAEWGAPVPAVPGTPIGTGAPTAPAAPVGPPDPNGLGVAASRIDKGPMKKARAAFAVAGAVLEEGEQVEAVVSGQLDGNPAVLMLTDRNVVIVDDRPWKPTVARLDVTGLQVQGMQDNRSAALTVVTADRQFVIDQIAAKELAVEMAQRIRYRAGT
ncbi:MAG: zinc ribbon domain-containing protein [Acidimicrobiales bacterium]|nr:zinc ribbon domain-containing protein [Acidimicrobiales bacterium]